MASNYVFGQPNDGSLGGNPRYLYALRRTDEGDLYFDRVDQLSNADSIQINTPGDENDNYTDFGSGVDFFEGRDVYHNLVYPNLNFEQMRWDSRNIYYYINEEGEFVARVNQKYIYNTPDNI
jgi:hypothetical protein